MSEEERLDMEDRARAQMFRDLYRPKPGKARFHMMARATYSHVGNNRGTASGRAGGVMVDLGQSWNYFGYAFTIVANGALISFPEDRKTQMLALLGGGPTLNLGRIAFIQRGFLDLRVGYDILYAPTRQLDRVGAVDPNADVTPRAPHGPRVDINAGLMMRPGNRRKQFFHGFGITVGWRGIVGSVTDPIPYMNMLSFGMNYWIG